MPERSVRVGVVEKNANPYWDLVNAGWEDAAAAFGMRVDVRSPEHEDVEAQLELLHGFLEDGVDALAFVGTVDGPFDDVCREARRRGIAVVTFDLDASREHRSLFVGMTDPETIGRQLGERVARELEGDGPVLLFAGSALARGAVGKMRGLVAAFEEAQREVVVSEPDGEDLDLALDHARKAFVAHPDAVAAVGVYGYHPAVLVRAAAESKLSVAVHGFDMLPETVDLLASGAVASSTWIREYYFGYLTAVAVNDLVRLGTTDVLELYGGVPSGAGRALELTPRVFTPSDVHEYVDWRAEIRQRRMPSHSN